ncbi:outer membrane beta-barrel protein [Sphingobacterium sp. Lzh-3]|uniref:outer membrane beta-barrel protein n=1 Tax=unclassified Sphingobacterium TaxID=2609468 RepID=UPI002953C6DD|nr:outer membrane beta-barrel protein [Sphingobacterium sp. UGAL515B_05]WON93075.1 outer membrane beta-barrel protein [Sphingobacterium sp. UGAL515B_05]
MCKPRNILLIFLGTLVATSSKSQIFLGLSSGYTRNYMINNFNKYFIKKVAPGHGFAYSIDAEMYLKEKISISLSLIYAQKKYSLVSGEPYEYTTKFNNNYFILPLKMQFDIPLGNKYYFLLSGGAYIGYWMNGYVMGVVPDIFSIDVSKNEDQIEYYRLVNYQDEYQFNMMRDKRSEFGTVLGTGIGFFVCRNIIIKLGVDYLGSLTGQERGILLNQKRKVNKTLVTSLGVKCFINIK